LSPDDINPYILTPKQREAWNTRLANARNQGLFTPPSFKDTVSIPGAQGGANWGTTAADPARGIVYVMGINVPSIYKLSADAPRPPGERRTGPAEIAAGAAIYDRRCQSCHGANLTGSGSYPSLVDITTRLGEELLRGAITGGGPGMPPNDDLSQQQLTALLAFLGNPTAVAAGRRANDDAAAALPPGPVVASGGAPAGRVIPPGRPGGMVGPPYPSGIPVPEVRMYTAYGMNGTIVKPPYSTLTAYDLNTGTIKWQVPAGGDDERAVAEGAKNTGYILQRTGIITTSAGLLFHAGGDSTLRIYDSETGQVLRTLPLPAGSRGIPAMYEMNGRQFLVVNATRAVARAVVQTPSPSSERAYVAFALPEQLMSK
jgi:quinoprotein glucose dehydrogenase